MKQLRDLLIELGFSPSYNNIFVSNDKYSITINKTYKGYTFEFVEWVNNSFGRRYECECRTSKPIKEYLKNNVRN